MGKMKIVFLLAQCTIPYLQNSITTITKVLKELDIDIETADLSKLPYFSGKKTKEMDRVIQSIEESRGVIAVSSVPMLSIHGAMQTFFDCATLYEAEKFDKPILAITYSDWLGEVEAAEKILKSWSIIGGTEGQKICLNKTTEFKEVSSRIERLAEDFYRMIKQDRQNIASSERQIFNFLKRGQALNSVGNETQIKTINKEEPAKEKKPAQIKSFVDILKQENKFEKPSEEPVANPVIDLSAKEQTIKEITHLLKKQVNEDETDELGAFTSVASGVYKKPARQALPQYNTKRLQQIPHYFIAKHDKSLEMNLRYVITNSNEEGHIIIKDGDCEYRESSEEPSVVELMLTDEVLSEILAKKITYQKAFMLGKLKVKGNFAILPKLDQIFTSL